MEDEAMEEQPMPGPSRTGLFYLEEVIGERWRRSQYKKRTADEAGITAQTMAK